MPLPGDLPPILHLLIIPHLSTLYCTCKHYTTLVHIIPHLYTLYCTCKHHTRLVLTILHFTHHTILACTMPHLLCAHNALHLCSSFQRAANQLRARTSDTWQMHSCFPFSFSVCSRHPVDIERLYPSLSWLSLLDSAHSVKTLHCVKTGHLLCQWSSMKFLFP